MDTGSLDPRLQQNAAAAGTAASTDSTSIISTPATQDISAQSPQQQQQQQHSSNDRHQHRPSLATATTNTSFSPQTPSSAISATTAYPSNENALPAPPPGGGHLLDKKARACESCRGLKVRCEPDPSIANPDEGPCRRCAKAGRACVVTQPTRKRQKKTDSRVAELEKKIDALTQSLQATRGGCSSTGGMGAGVARDRGREEVEDERRVTAFQLSGVSRVAWASAAAADGHTPRTPAMGMGMGPAKYGGIEVDYTKGSGSSQPPMVMAGQKRKFAESSRDATAAAEGERESGVTATQAPAQGVAGGHEYADAIDRGVLSAETANELWTRYNERMVPHLPGVVFAAGTTAAEVRKTKPVLFLAVMAVASSELPSVQRTLTKELMQILADKVIVVGDKSLELVQALQVAVMWYWPPEHFEELKFYQLVHIAAVMAIDIGLGRKSSFNGGGFGLRKHIPAEWRHQHFKKHAPADSTSVEARRAWLACYFLATNTSMALHRPNLIRWNSFMTECVDILESSPDAAPTDKYFCHLVWTHKLAEDVGIQFAMDDPGASINISDARTQYALRGFERDLEKYRNSVSEELRQPSLLLSFHVLNLYMHEIATQPENQEEWKVANSGDTIRDALVTDERLTPAHINALSACLTAIDGIFEVFLSMEVTSIRCLPVFNFVRVAYAVVVLIKMYFAASSPKSELGKVINKDNMKVEQHLDNLLEKFGATAADERSRPASKFLVVLVMLRSWFHKQKGGKAAENPQPPASTSTEYKTPNTSSPTANRSQPQVHDQTPQQQQQHQQPQSDYSSTPLQLLSEIATNDSNATNTGATPRPGNASFYWAGRQPAQPFMYDDSNTNSSSTPTNNTSGLTPGGGVPATSSTAANAAAEPPDNNFQFVTGEGTGIPWLNAADLDYSNLLGDGFAQAMDLTLAGIADGSMMQVIPAGVWDAGNRYVLQDPGFMNGLDGMGMGGGSGGGSGGGGGGGGGYQF